MVNNSGSKIIFIIEDFYRAPTFWAVPQKFLDREAAAAAIGLINAVGNLGGIVGPIVVGFLKSYTGSFVDGVYAMALFSFLAGIVMLLVKKKQFFSHTLFIIYCRHLFVLNSSLLSFFLF